MSFLTQELGNGFDLYGSGFFPVFIFPMFFLGISNCGQIVRRMQVKLKSKGQLGVDLPIGADW